MTVIEVSTDPADIEFGLPSESPPSDQPVAVHRPGSSYVDIFKGDNNGAFVIQTNVTEPEKFLEIAALRLVAALDETRGDEEFTAEHCLPLICATWARLKGYKADNVFEQRVLTAGEPDPGSLRQVA